MLINDIDGDIAEQAASEIDGETAVFSGDLTKDGRSRRAGRKGATRPSARSTSSSTTPATRFDGVIHKMTDEQFQAMLDIHTIVPFRMIRALAPTWREAAKAEKAEGKEYFRKIVNISSISGTMGNAGPGQLLVGQGGRRRPDQDRRQGVGLSSRSTSTPSPSASSRRA